MRFKTLISFVVLLLSGFLVVVGQEKSDDTNKKNDKEKSQKKPAKVNLKKGLTTGPQIAELAIFIYSNGRGRPGLAQIRKTTVEIGKIKSTNPDGSTVNSQYEQRTLRAGSLKQERVHLNQKFPDAQYALIYNGKKIFGLYNDSVFTPKKDAVKTFENRVWHGPEALLRYRENEATCKLVKQEKIMGVTFYVVNVSDKENRKTTFYVSKKSIRIMMLTYEQDGVKYKRKFYDHNYAQNILVPYRSVLWANGKIVEEKSISTIAFGQALDEGIFQENVAQVP